MSNCKFCGAKPVNPHLWECGTQLWEEDSVGIEYWPGCEPTEEDKKDTYERHELCETREANFTLRSELELRDFDFKRALEAKNKAEEELAIAKGNEFTAHVDWAETDTKVKALLEPILGKEFIEGDSYGVPSIEDCVEKAVEELQKLRKLLQDSIEVIEELGCPLTAQGIREALDIPTDAEIENKLSGKDVVLRNAYEFIKALRDATPDEATDLLTNNVGEDVEAELEAILGITTKEE